MKRFIKKVWFSWLVVVLVLVSPTIFSLGVKGFYGASDDMHTAWLFEMDRAIKSGQFPPRFVPDLSYQFGYPLFNFVFPTPFYIGEAFYLMGFGLVDSIKLVFGTSTLISAIFMFILVKRITKDNMLSLAAAVLYAYTPYRATDLYVRGAIGEIVVFAFFPLIILSLLEALRNNKLFIGIGGLAIALLITSHNISAYMFLPLSLVLVFLYYTFSKKPNFTSLASVIFVYLLGLLISVYFWLPAILESRLMAYDTVFNYFDHFPTIKQLISPHFGYGASVPGPYDGMSFFIGVVNILVIILGIGYGLKKYKLMSITKKTLYLWMLIVVFVSVFMMNHRSSFLWERVPLLPYFQFPWRFLTMITFISPLFLVFFDKFKYRKALAVFVIIVSIGLNIGYFKPQEFLGRDDRYYLERYVPFPDVNPEYTKINEEYLRLPIDTRVRPDRIFPRFYTNDKNTITNINELNALDGIARTNSQKEFQLNYNKYNFPGWKVFVNGEEQRIYSGTPFGQIVINVPKGQHEVKVVYRETGFRIMTNFISFFSLTVVGYLVLRKKKK